MWANKEEIPALRLASNTRGNVAMMFAVSTTCLLTAVGAAVDYSGMTKTRMLLQHQVDASVLAAARIQPTPGRTNVKNKDRKKVVADVLVQNGYDLAYSQPRIKIMNPTITVEAKAPYKTVFMGLIGKSTVDISASAQSQINAGGKVEIALVLDNTASMEVNGKLAALKTGGDSLLSTLESFPPDKVTVSIVPFAKNINVGTIYRDAVWLDMPEEYTITRSVTRTTYSGGTPGTCTTEPATRTRDGSTYTYDREVCTGGTPGTPTTTTSDEDFVAEWEGCVGARPSNLHVEDGSYSTRIPGITRFEAVERSSHDRDRYNRCPRAITPLTNDFTLLKDSIDDLFASDTTYMPLGVAWGMRVLSPAEPFPEGTTGQDVRKIMIVMTDGVNTVHLDNPPYLDDNDSSTATSLVEQTSKDTLKACRKARQANIEIVTIAFQVTDTATKDMLQTCASGKKNYHDAGDNATLIATFEKIGARLNEVRLTQ